MTGEEVQDVEAILVEIALRRPSYLVSRTLSDEHIAWAIKELEEEGLQPTTGRICRAIGHGTQKSAASYVNAYYRQRSETRNLPLFDPNIEAVNELYDVVAKHVRRAVLSDLASEHDHLREAKRIVDQKHAEAMSKLALAEERHAEADATRESIRAELESDRQARAALQSHLDESLVDFTRLQQSYNAASEQLRKAQQQNQDAASRIHDLIDERSALQAALTESETRRAAGELHQGKLAGELAKLREALVESENLLAVEREKLRHMIGELRGARDSISRLRSKSDQAAAMLTRERAMLRIQEAQNSQLEADRRQLRIQATYAMRKSSKLQEEISAARLMSNESRRRLAVLQQELAMLRSKR